MPRFIFPLIVLLAWQTGGRAVDFDHQVVPILRKHCVQCHGGSEAKGGLSINTREGFFEDKAAVVGDSAASHFLDLIRSADVDLQMPPKEHDRVPAAEIATLAKWVDDGMSWTPGFSFAGNAYQPPLLPRQVTLPGDDDEHPVDRLLARYLAERKIDPPQPVRDLTFVRRASLDLNGLLPSIDVVQQFAVSKSPNKRGELIDQLLANDMAYAEHWLTFWNDWLRNDYDGTGFITGGRKQISSWLYQSLIHNKPYDQFTRELVAPEGNESRGFIDGIKWRGTVSAGQTLEIQFAQSVAQSFLGINLKCASCHDSFIDRWKLSEAYSLAAVYASAPLEVHRCDKPIGTQATAAWLFPEIGQIDPQANRDQRLKQLAALMTSEKNGRFSRTIVNRLWAALMGRGIVHPLDAMHTRPWDEDLLDYLANYLVEQNYDLKAVLRLIATSNAYSSASEHRSGEQNVESKFVYAGPRAKRMTAEQFLDSVWQLTGAAPLKFDAPVIRGGSSSEPGSPIQLQAEWIWGESAKDGKAPPGGEQLVFRRQLDLPSPVATGAAVVTADNAFEMYIGRREITSSNEWTQVRSVPLAGLLKKGKSEIVVVARNFLDTPNLAGLFFEARLKLEGGETVTIKSDNGWEVSSTSPVGGREGRLGKISGPWTSATSIGRPQPYAGIYPQAENSLALGLAGTSAMVRASLLKADFLMRSLGRPNRDQIVTSRPSDLTTLEAIDLANGQSLAKALSTGARNLLARQELSPAEMVDDVFRRALSRPPSDAEKETLLSAIGQQPTQQAIEDVLWAICMMPEFVMVR